MLLLLSWLPEWTLVLFVRRFSDHDFFLIFVTDKIVFLCFFFTCIFSLLTSYCYEPFQFFGTLIFSLTDVVSWVVRHLAFSDVFQLSILPHREKSHLVPTTTYIALPDNFQPLASRSLLVGPPRSSIEWRLTLGCSVGQTWSHPSSSLCMVSPQSVFSLVHLLLSCRG